MSEDTIGAGSTSEPSSTASASAPASAPSSIDAALDQSFESFTASLSGAPETPAPATTEGAAPTTVEPPPATELSGPPPDEGKKGPIPFDAHKTALENARTKEREVVMAQLQQEIAPYADVLQAVIEDEQAGSIAGLDRILQRYAQNPALQPQLRSYFGRMLSQQRGQQQAPADPEPEADLQTADGALVYSAGQLKKWQEWNQRQIEAKFAQQLQPLQQFTQQQQWLAKVAELREHARAGAERTLAEHRQDPEFVAHEAQVRDTLKAMWETNPNATLDQAWFKVYRDIVVPKKVAEQQQSMVSTAVKKSLGSTAEPAAAAPAQPRRFRSPDEALDAYYESVNAS